MESMIITIFDHFSDFVCLCARGGSNIGQRLVGG